MRVISVVSVWLLNGSVLPICYLVKSPSLILSWLVYWGFCWRPPNHIIVIIVVLILLGVRACSYCFLEHKDYKTIITIAKTVNNVYHKTVDVSRVSP